MEAIYLVKKDNPAEVVAYACGKCGTVTGTVESVATDHCAPKMCTKCGKVREYSSYLLCNECRAMKDAEAEAERFDRAEKVTDWDGPVYDPNCGGCQDGYFQSVDDLLDHYADDDAGPPAYVWATTMTHPSLDADSLMDQALDDTYDGCTLDAEDELVEFIGRWNDKQSCEIWWEDKSKAVVISATTVCACGMPGGQHKVRCTSRDGQPGLSTTTVSEEE